MLKRRFAYNPSIDWSAEEETQLLEHIRHNKLNAKLLTKLYPNRTLPSIRSKVRKLRIKHDLFGKSYRDTKSAFTSNIANLKAPKSVFDAYAGAGHQTMEWIKVARIVYASEIRKNKFNQFYNTVSNYDFKEITSDLAGWTKFVKEDKIIYLHIGDAVVAASLLQANRIKVDMIDLDTCGSTLPTLPLFLLTVKPKNLVITHGEFHSMRFQREDVLRRLLMHKDITENPFPLNTESLAYELDKAVKIAGLRAHNETINSFWLELDSETWLGGKAKGMLRRCYNVTKPRATADCINFLTSS